MDLKTLKAKKNAAKSGVPDHLVDREVMEASKVRANFVNDEPVVIVRKPKHQKDKDSGTYSRVFSRSGKPLFSMVAYIPIDVDGTKAVVVTATEENIEILKPMIDGTQPKLIRGESAEDIDRWEEFTAPEVIDGTLRFVWQPKKYRNGTVYDVPVLDSVE